MGTISQKEKLGKKYNIGPVRKWADKITSQADSFDMENLSVTLNYFPELIDKVKKLTVADISEELDSKFAKLAKKNKKQLKIIDKKIRQILKDPYHFKNLRGDMYGAYRVHIDKSFVLTYEIDEKKNVVRLLDYEHHDKIY